MSDINSTYHLELEDDQVSHLLYKIGHYLYDIRNILSTFWITKCSIYSVTKPCSIPLSTKASSGIQYNFLLVLFHCWKQETNSILRYYLLKVQILTLFRIITNTEWMKYFLCILHVFANQISLILLLLMMHWLAKTL